MEDANTDTVAPEQETLNQLPQKPNPIVVYILTIVICGVASGGLTYYLMKKQSASTQSNLQSQINTLQQQLASAPTTTWNPYTNPRYGFSIEYPSDFIASPEAVDGDGQTWKSSDGSISLTSWGGNNALDNTLNQEVANAKDLYDTVSYETEGSNWFVISGTNNGDLYYYKEYVGAGSEDAFVLEYSPANTTKGGDYSTHIASVFKPGDLTIAH